MQPERKNMYEVLAYIAKENMLGRKSREGKNMHRIRNYA